ncbi:MAG: phage major capsid protein, partial [Spiribacter salinus]
HRPPSSLASHVTKSQGWADIKAGKKDSGSIIIPHSVKSTLTSLQGSSDSPQAGYDVQADRAGGLFGWGYRPLRLIDAMRVVQTGSNTVEHTRMDGFSNAAAAQNGEAATKAMQSIDPVLVESRISTIALVKRISKQLLDDEAMLQAELALLFNHLIRERLERDLVNGDGSAFSIDGLLNQGTTYTAETGATQPDGIGEMLAAMASDGYEPSFVALNPNDHQTNRAERSSSDNLYVAGSWAAPAPAMYWGVPAVVTPAVPAGEVVAVSNAHVAYLDRQAAEVRFYEQDSDNVQKNLVTLRGEIRGGLMIGDAQGVRVLSIP